MTTTKGKQTMTDETTKNKSKDITDIVPENVLDDIFTSLTQGKNDEKRMTFYLYWLFGFPIKTCGNKAGYSESYSYNLVHDYKKKPKLRRSVDEILEMFPERYKSVCKLRLPQVAEIEGKALQEYEDNPKLAIDKPQLLKQVKQGAGALQDDGPPQINFNEIAFIARQKMIEINNQSQPDNDSTVDAELIETDTK